MKVANPLCGRVPQSVLPSGKDEEPSNKEKAARGHVIRVRLKTKRHLRERS